MAVNERSDRLASKGLQRESYFIGQCDEEPQEFTCRDCLRYWSFNFLVNGMFTTSRIVGYAQFMVFMILRVIITGSLCGRLYGNDPETINCSFVFSDEIERRSIGSLLGPFNKSSIDIQSHYVKSTCLSAAYWNVSPTTLWALSLLTFILPWLLLIPWTPLNDGQDYFLCKPTNVQWPCLTIYVVRFMKACLRLVLEFLFTITVPIVYGSGIEPTIKCFQKNVVCYIENSKEKTYFLWLFTAVNLLSCFLTVCELVDICRNKHFYETDRGGYAASNKLSSNRSSTATMNTTTSHFNYKSDHPDVRRGRTKTGNIVPQAPHKCRLGESRRPEKDISGKSDQSKSRRKFKMRHFRQADGDEVIKLAATIDEENKPVTSRVLLKKDIIGKTDEPSKSHTVLYELPTAATCPADVNSAVTGVADQC